MLLSNGVKIGFECDGKEYHDSSRDDWRDAMILGGGHVDSIFRFRGCDLTYHLEDLLFIVSRYEPNIFSKRGLLNLSNLASSFIRNRDFQLTDTSVLYSVISDVDDLRHMVTVDRKHSIVSDEHTQFWMSAFLYANKFTGCDLDAVIENYRSDGKE